MKNKGLTLIELLVAITLLSLVMGAVVGIFAYVVRSQARDLASQQLLNQTSYVMEYMSRALRMAKKDSSGSCLETANLNYLKTLSGNGIRFLNYRNKCQEFRLDTSTKRLQEGKSTTASKDDFGSWIDLTSDRLEVVSFNIGPANSWDQGDYEQPRVTIFFDIKGKGGGVKPEEQPRIKIQTTISQRNLDTTE
ncbi:MAG: hypothetical protein CO031_00820 [Candidatus Nealsonbacteria bacterium CG_4_9_14_0_2_um_filter_37_38]|uniref:Type II secretion system protein J n=1 Tax=Candidatus Nealsonbacteria bacterium CG_4_10_14_0_8_um_filter_37_14 TaxID=1974684 RepID=A0A2M7R755_9BACT|nr:MAG: hypothetical protein COV63_00045 [Candidatus Nealsonbacteria bacterium CG11_big_fil_rev_8_21_14_0_20_37_68]PIW92218.1 MAG: hypothetical protein COZ89_01065 [Candidatus Nealsonbacteria bacterium CG_4_8_14_3_um_filter_37_23]PIY89211.1 MAG: hypothetical protein COY73_01685 [Candidatus Nealsonbacteria bacterium CG_4_10_14_0_8_um_filter_37_14]PJC51788.1 MAG: hypothetical protein CO031_00820 [Candidatus Nealsonbacteria bacterium CG_4_9_14_0_2_um_filter_37_38]